MIGLTPLAKKKAVTKPIVMGADPCLVAATGCDIHSRLFFPLAAVSNAKTFFPFI
jgi:hypothetical protein